MVMGILEGWISGSERLLDTSLIQGGELEIFVRFEPLILCHASLCLITLIFLILRFFFPSDNINSKKEYKV